MAHFAELDSNNKVLRVVVVNNNELLINNVENEQKGIDFCKSLYGQNTNWKQCSYNTHYGKYRIFDENGVHIISNDQSKSFRKNFPSKGYTYDEIRDAFIPEKKYNSWNWDENNWDWIPPKPYPHEEAFQKNTYFIWDENVKDWVEQTPELVDNYLSKNI